MSKIEVHEENEDCAISLECDSCHDVLSGPRNGALLGFEDEEGMRRAAHEYGWHMEPETDLCPECRQAVAVD
jgi:hypothetical protein